MEQEDGSEVVLLSILDPETVDDTTNIDDRVSERAAIQSAKEELIDADLPVTTLGIPNANRPDGIIQGIKQTNADRAYMYSRKRTPAGKAIFGSTIGDVLARSPVPVVVIPSMDR
ncbi:universal stress protein [Halorussus limi]|uniref:Universal stress protein n=2 Tax=Halorussus limi TaxID=2938695 RepID=A0A8U0HVW2_9EURY|nr:universal stress protein [Halorussus limi]